VGVDACLEIERARCAAADACEAAEVAACKRQVDVQCLHGFSKSAQPSPREADQCAQALGQVAECVSKRGRKVAPDTCELELSQKSPARACELVQSPHVLRACRFLERDEDNEQDNDAEDDNTRDEDDEQNNTGSEDASATRDE
jgi:hypothetical protein